jgi:hypothetical protein
MIWCSARSVASAPAAQAGHRPRATSPVRHRRAPATASPITVVMMCPSPISSISPRLWAEHIPIAARTRARISALLKVSISNQEKKLRSASATCVQAGHPGSASKRSSSLRTYPFSASGVGATVLGASLADRSRARPVNESRRLNRDHLPFGSSGSPPGSQQSRRHSPRRRSHQRQEARPKASFIAYREGYRGAVAAIVSRDARCHRRHNARRSPAPPRSASAGCTWPPARTGLARRS